MKRNFFLNIIFGAVLFFYAFSVQAAYESQCATGQESGPQNNCTHENDTAILSQQCSLRYTPIQCSSMSSYLSAMQADCNQSAPQNVDCAMITQNGIYGREASEFAQYQETSAATSSAGAGSSTGASTGVPMSGSQGEGSSAAATGELDYPTEFNLPDHQGGVRGILMTLLNWLLIVAAILAVIAFIISGLQYLTSSGDTKLIETAKRNMVYSILGVITALSGFILIRAVDAALRANILF